MKGVNGHTLELVMAFLMQSGTSAKNIVKVEENAPEDMGPLPPNTVWRHEIENEEDLANTQVILYHTPVAAPTPAIDVDKLKAEILKEVEGMIAEAIGPEALMQAFVQLAAQTADTDESAQPEPPAPPATTPRPFWITDEESPAPPARTWPTRQPVDPAPWEPDTEPAHLRRRQVDVPFDRDDLPGARDDEERPYEPKILVAEVRERDTTRTSTPHFDPQSLVEKPWDDNAKATLEGAEIPFEVWENVTKDGPPTPTVKTVAIDHGTIKLTFERKKKGLERERLHKVD